MIRRIVRELGPYEFQPIPFAAILAMFFLVYNLGVYSDRYLTDSTFNRQGVIPGVVVAVAFGLIMTGFRAIQRRYGLTWWTYILPLAAMGFIVPTLRAVLDFLPQLPDGSQAYPASVFRSFIVLWFITAILGSVASRMARQTRETEKALEIAREQQIQIITADEEARRQVAIVLHDRVQAGLITSCLELQALAGELDTEGAKRLDPMIRRLEELRIFDVRGAARVLSPNLEEIDLQTALEELALQFEVALAIEIDVDEAMDLDRMILGSGLPLAAYRIVEQGLLNAVVHAAASRVDVKITRTPEGCRVTVADDGVGMSANAGRGLGTTLVTTWTRAMHGTWHWETGLDGRGTTLVAELRATELTA